jgi:hypothetical protein
LSLIINPQIKDELGDNFEALFTFPIPEVQHDPYHWNNDPILSLKDGIVTPETVDDFIITVPESPQFPGFEGEDTYSSGINYVSKIDELEGFIFRSENPYTNIAKWLEVEEDVTGDTDRLYIFKQFRISFDNYVWSDWADLTVDNLNLYAAGASELFIEFKYFALPAENRFNTVIPVDIPKTIGWSKVSSGSHVYTFDKDYSDKGTLTFKIGDVELTSNNILFGKQLQTAGSVPKEGDYIFINPLFQNIKIDYDTVLEISFVESELVAEHANALYLHSLRLIAEKEEERVEELFALSNIGERKILTPPFLMKVFKITNFHLSVSGVTDTRTLEVHYRYSANRKKWSNWEVLTKKNISTIQIDTLSFFYIEVAFTRTGTDASCDSKIYVNDLVFEGDIQNVTADYQKINKFGLRSDCDYCDTCGDACAGDESEPKPQDEWNDPTKQGTFTPYEIYKNVSLYNKLANDAVNTIGWEVTYYTTAPDGAGKDRFLKEYQLYNYGEYKDIKVIPADNKLPDSALVMNGFDFALMESFEVHITKDMFKRAFGLDARPAKKDRIWFCQSNKLYEVEHSQPSNNFMDADVYYKLRLKPASNDLSIGNIESTSLGDLMKNNSIDSLFGDAIQQDMDKVMKKDTLANLSDSTSRKSLKAPTAKYDLQNGVNLVSRNYYSLQTLAGRPAVIYKATDSIMVESEDRTFMCWFNINELTDSHSYNFIDNHYNDQGYNVSYEAGRFIIRWNSLVYEAPVTLAADTWYAVIINMNQRQQKLEWNVYSRYSPTTAGSHSINDLKLIAKGEEELVPQSWNNDKLVLQVIGSPMFYTNMRIFKTSIPEDKHFRVLNQYIIKDTTDLLVADNANNKIIAPSHKF